MENIIEKITLNFNGEPIIKNIDKNKLKDFTQKFYGLVVLTARAPDENYSNIRIDAYPYINNQVTKEYLSKNYPEYNSNETILLHFKASEKQELFVTELGIYFKMLDLIEDEYNQGFVPFKNISSLELVQSGDYFCLKCNEILLITDNVKNRNFFEDIDLNEYFIHISKKKFYSFGR